MLKVKKPGPVGDFLMRNGLIEGKSRRGRDKGLIPTAGEIVLGESKCDAEGQRPSERPAPNKTMEPKEHFTTPRKGGQNLSLNREALGADSPVATPDSELKSILQSASDKAAIDAASEVVKKIDFGQAQSDAMTTQSDTSMQSSSSSSSSQGSEQGSSQGTSNPKQAAAMTAEGTHSTSSSAPPPASTDGTATTQSPQPAANLQQQTMTDSSKPATHQQRAPTTIAKTPDTDRKRVKTGGQKVSERVTTRTPVKTVSVSKGKSSKRKVTPQSQVPK